MEKFRLSECLAQLRQDLLDSASEGEGSELRFEIADIDLEFQIVAAKKAKGDVKASWWVLSASAGGEASNAITQKLHLKLKPVSSDTDEPFKAGDEDSAPARKGQSRKK